MSIDFAPQQWEETKPRITVIGVGGAGGNAVNNMINGGLEGVEFVVANTDSQSLQQSLSEQRIQLGVNVTHGLGAGARPDIGRVAAEEALDDIQQYLEANNMVFIAAGMGGGTGTGAAPIIARAAREQGILTVGVVTKPFQFEGVQRMRLAEEGLRELQQYVDTLIVIPNQNLFRVANEHTTFAAAFNLADEVLHAGVRGVTDLMVSPGLINLDFADIRTVMGEMGKAMMGTGEAEGDGRALQAAEKAIANPLLDGVSMRGAKGVIVSIVGGEDMRLMEVDEAANHIRELVDPDANIIWGSAFNDNLNGKIRVSVVATGIDNDVGNHAAPLTQPFSFASRPAVSVPQSAAPKAAAPAPAPQAAPAPAPEPETLELDVPEAPAPAPVAAAAPAPFAAPRPVAVFSDDDPAEDELVLGAESAAPPPPAEPAPRVASGGTLFERMAGLTRGTEKSPAADEGAPGMDIPRFLNRQNNQ